MDLHDEYVQTCAANEAILNSADATPNEKAAAWRRQALIIHSISSDLPHITSSALMTQHYSKLNSKAHNEYMQERVESVKMLLKAFPNQTKAKKESLDEFLKIDDNLFEPPCHGKYESCIHDEITAEDLKSLLKPESPKSPPPVDIYTHKNIESKVSGAGGVTPSSSPIMNFWRNKQKWSMGNSAGAARSSSALPKANAAGGASNYTTALGSFRTAREELALQNLKKESFFKNAPSTSAAGLGTLKRTLGGRRTVRSDFILPTKEKPVMICNTAAEVISPSPPSIGSSPEMIDERLSNIDPKMIDIITKEIMCNVQAVDWDDIAGLEYAKSIIIETIICPLLRPDIYTGLRAPRRGILLFGPPGTGKTLIAKCIASQSKSTFFSISPSILTSKYVGEGEKMVRALFAVATTMQPSVIFIDEIDSLLSQRSETEHDSSRRLKTEFLIQFDGAATSDDDRILFIAATNRPQELDDAARRRFEKRLYIPLPEERARIQIITNLLQKVQHNLSAGEIKEMGGAFTEGYSCADMKSLCVEASMEPVRAIPLAEFANFDKDNIRAINVQDFHTALQKVRPSVSQKDLKQYVEWNSIYGALR